MSDDELTMDERREALGKRVAALSAEGIQIDFTPPRVDMLTQQVFEELHASREAFEAAWVIKCEEIVDDVESKVNRAKLLSGKGGAMPGQLTLVKS